MSTAASRGNWGSRAGFILAAAGSAIGLGNIWGFPTQVGQGGGAAFVLVYLFCVFMICAPIMIAEIAIGRRSQKDPVGAFHAIKPNTAWWLAGLLGVLAGIGILSFYSVIAGWTIAYIWFSATGGHLFGAAFFIMLTMAALTSTISLLEVPVAHLIDSHGWTRARAVIAVTSLTAILAVPSALSNGASTFLSRLPGIEMDFLSLMATVWNNFALPIGGLLIALFVGWAWKIPEALHELRHGGRMPGAGLWGALIKYVCPVGIAIIIVFTVRAAVGV